MLEKIHRWLTYTFAIIFAIGFFSLLVLVTLFLVGVQTLDIIFIPFDVLEAFPYIYLLPIIILFAALPLAIIRRRPSAILNTLSSIIFIVAAIIYYLYAGSESSTTQLIGLAGTAFCYSLAMMLVIIAAFIISGRRKAK